MTVHAINFYLGRTPVLWSQNDVYQLHPSLNLTRTAPIGRKDTDKNINIHPTIKPGQTKISRKKMFFLVVFLGTTICAQREKPNILFILTDDLGWSDVGWNNRNSNSTPFLDTLINSSTKLTQLYATHRCSPTPKGQ